MIDFCRTSSLLGLVVGIGEEVAGVIPEAPEGLFLELGFAYF